MHYKPNNQAQPSVITWCIKGSSWELQPPPPGLGYKSDSAGHCEQCCSIPLGSRTKEQQCKRGLMYVLEVMAISEGLSTCIAIQKCCFKLTLFLNSFLCTSKGSLATQEPMGLSSTPHSRATQLKPQGPSQSCLHISYTTPGCPLYSKTTCHFGLYLDLLPPSGCHYHPILSTLAKTVPCKGSIKWPSKY